MNHDFNNMFALGKKSYKKSFQKELHPMDSSMLINRKQKEAIGKSVYSPNFTIQYSNGNDVKGALNRTRAAGTVAPKKSNVYYK